MSNLSAIGFPVQTEEEFATLLEEACDKGERLKTEGGFYICYSDRSGAELWLQFDDEEELIGMNPHFKGQSRVSVGLIHPVPRPQSPLDGAWFGWANPKDLSDPESGDFPFVFDAPDFRLQEADAQRRTALFQITAFPQEVTYFPNETAFSQAQEGEKVPFSAQSFIPVGLFSKNRDHDPDAQVLMTGIVRRAEKRKNQISGVWFIWIELESFGVTIDLVVDPADLVVSPSAGGVIQCQAWLSGQMVGR